MNGPIEQTNSQSVLPTPRTSLQNVGEKRDDDEKDASGRTFQAFGPDGFTFLDFLDVINPLQHIPFVGTLYRDLTGDEIDPGSRIAGGTLFGGPIGTVIAMTNVAVEESTGQDMGQHMMAWFGDGDGQNPADGDAIQLANTPPAEFVTAAGADERSDTASPIATNAEVLDWARRETARTAEDGGQARLKTPTAGAIDIATNLEVLNWARQEAGLSRSAVETAGAETLDQRKAIRQSVESERLASLDKTHALGRDQSQLVGATAPLGGWFSETMLLALARYDEGAQLGKKPADRVVEATMDISK